MNMLFSISREPRRRFRTVRQVRAARGIGSCPRASVNRSMSRAASAVGRSTKKTTWRLTEFAKDRRGVTALEYAFIGGLAAIAIVAAVTTLGTNVSGLIQSVTAGL